MKPRSDEADGGVIRSTDRLTTATKPIPHPAGANRTARRHRSRGRRRRASASSAVAHKKIVTSSRPSPNMP
ncbi:hypothetical protein [Frankia sp. CiP3]|uniref:hypothetical protein n=1 Tax=Frankia sp. CiP3 TaxID=2880971 RepID=UPI0035B23209